MRSPSGLALVSTALMLSACVSTAPLDLPVDNPANPTAASGTVDTPRALADYKSADDFEGRAAADAETPPSGHSGHGGMAMPHGGMRDMPNTSHSNMAGMNRGGTSGRSDGGMSGMSHGEAPQGAGNR